MISVFANGSIFKIKFFKFSAAEAPAALIKNSLSSLIFPSTIKIELAKETKLYFDLTQTSLFDAQTEERI